MEFIMNLAGLRCIYFFCFAIIFFGCTVSYEEPTISLDDYEIERGFELEVVASEPLLEAPVAIEFDTKGRVWAVEMRGYMQNIEGLNEEMPNGRIVILEDLDKDGVMDHRKIFLDSLILPRAIALVYGGLLYAEPPNLWFVSINDDLPGKKVLVDSLFADAGNVEHQPNGLLLNIDNWIYNAKSNFRYKKSGERWIKSPTTFRGQWGITQDNLGRLFYNHNSALLLGDYMLPNVLIKNKYFRPRFGVQKLLSESQQINPIHPTLVNRGYHPGVLDEDSILTSATSACGPLIYRGQQFGEAYDENAFVCLPEGNLVKRLKISYNNQEIIATPTHDSVEFLASTDEGFRPVNLKTGPDGNLYIVDMHRGIIQHAAYMSGYLKRHLQESELGNLIGMGRILRVKKEGETPINVSDIDWDNPDKLLYHENSWIREKAQHLLVYQKQHSKVEKIEEIALDANSPTAQIHAIRILAEFNQLTYDLVNKILRTSTSEVIVHALISIDEIPDHKNTEELESILTASISKKDMMIDLYLGHILGDLDKTSRPSALSKLSLIAKRYPGNKLVAESITSGIEGHENVLLDHLDKGDTVGLSDLINNLRLSLSNTAASKLNPIYTIEGVYEDDRTRGLKLYRKICANCHGIDGAGISNLAPPLSPSAYVKGPPEQLGLIILHGLRGPIKVNGKTYELNAVMPGLTNNETLTDEDIAGIINYVKNAFSTDYRFASAAKIKALRDEKPAGGSLYTDEELKQWLRTNNIDL